MAGNEVSLSTQVCNRPEPAIAVHRLTYRRTNHKNLHVRGEIEPV